MATNHSGRHLMAEPAASSRQLQLVRGNSVATLNQIYQHQNSIPVRSRLLHNAKSLQQPSMDSVEVVGGGGCYPAAQSNNNTFASGLSETALMASGSSSIARSQKDGSSTFLLPTGAPVSQDQIPFQHHQSTGSRKGTPAMQMHMAPGSAAEQPAGIHNFAGVQVINVARRHKKQSSESYESPVFQQHRSSPQPTTYGHHQYQQHPVDGWASDEQIEMALGQLSPPVVGGSSPSSGFHMERLSRKSLDAKQHQQIQQHQKQSTMMSAGALSVHQSLSRSPSPSRSPLATAASTSEPLGPRRRLLPAQPNHTCSMELSDQQHQHQPEPKQKQKQEPQLGSDQSAFKPALSLRRHRRLPQIPTTSANNTTRPAPAPLNQQQAYPLQTSGQLTEQPPLLQAVSPRVSAHFQSPSSQQQQQHQQPPQQRPKLSFSSSSSSNSPQTLSHQHLLNPVKSFTFDQQHQPTSHASTGDAGSLGIVCHSPSGTQFTATGASNSFSGQLPEVAQVASTQQDENRLLAVSLESPANRGRRRLSSCGLGTRASFLLNKQHAICDFSTPPRSLDSSNSRGSIDLSGGAASGPSGGPPNWTTTELGVQARRNNSASLPKTAAPTAGQQLLYQSGSGAHHRQLGSPLTVDQGGQREEEQQQQQKHLMMLGLATVRHQQQRGFLRRPSGVSAGLPPRAASATEATVNGSGELGNGPLIASQLTPLARSMITVQPYCGMNVAQQQQQLQQQTDTWMESQQQQLPAISRLNVGCGGPSERHCITSAVSIDVYRTAEPAGQPFAGPQEHLLDPGGGGGGSSNQQQLQQHHLTQDRSTGRASLALPCQRDRQHSNVSTSSMPVGPFAVSCSPRATSCDSSPKSRPLLPQGQSAAGAAGSSSATPVRHHPKSIWSEEQFVGGFSATGAASGQYGGGGGYGSELARFQAGQQHWLARSAEQLAMASIHHQQAPQRAVAAPPNSSSLSSIASGSSSSTSDGGASSSSPFDSSSSSASSFNEDASVPRLHKKQHNQLAVALRERQRMRRHKNNPPRKPHESLMNNNNNNNSRLPPAATTTVNQQSHRKHSPRNVVDEQTLSDRLRLAERSASRLFRRVELSPLKVASSKQNSADSNASMERGCLASGKSSGFPMSLDLPASSTGLSLSTGAQKAACPSAATAPSNGHESGQRSPGDKQSQSIHDKRTSGNDEDPEQADDLSLLLRSFDNTPHHSSSKRQTAATAAASITANHSPPPEARPEHPEVGPSGSSNKKPSAARRVVQRAVTIRELLVRNWGAAARRSSSTHCEAYLAHNNNNNLPFNNPSSTSKPAPAVHQQLRKRASLVQPRALQKQQEEQAKQIGGRRKPNRMQSGSP